MLASSPGSSQLFNVMCRKTGEEPGEEPGDEAVYTHVTACYEKLYPCSHTVKNGVFQVMVIFNTPGV